MKNALGMTLALFLLSGCSENAEQTSQSAQTAQVVAPALENPAGTGITYEQATKTIDSEIALKSSPLANGEDRHMGATNDDLAVLEIVGPKENITKAYLMVIVSSDASPQASDRNRILFSQFVKNVVPNSPEAEEWAEAAKKKVLKTPNVEQHKAFGANTLSVKFLEPLAFLSVSLAKSSSGGEAPSAETPAPNAENIEPASAFGTFAEETKRLESAVRCTNGKVSRDEGMPDLWGCIDGVAETVKLFVNESETDGRVANVKFMWNDWTNDVGYGLHADKSLAEGWAKAVASTYAPQQVSEIMSAFKGKGNKTITNDKFSLAYTYDQGPSIGERMIVITAR